jgi:hypothetical protein
MQATEALTHLIALGDAMTAAPVEGTERVRPRTEEEQERDTLAISVCQAMLNTALPVARFRLFVRIENGKDDGREFTVCGVKIEDIIAAMTPYQNSARKLYVTLWEQRATGADMLEGFQGWTRVAGKPSLKLYLEGLKKYSNEGTAH